ncbi:MAG: mechanosensitive ion channel family protein [Pontiellaceae bacterium]|nr:mechanosensitive ion channel family protein [Pontiellaceae bacterium]MBN2784509.1 mechanosensitive ion channel family protein [Pontiellaceae bacterium]
MEKFLIWMDVNRASIILCALLLVVGLPLVQLLGFLIRRGLKNKVTDQAVMLLSKGIVYIGSLIIFLTVLNQAGVKLGTLLGAAGIAGVAIGFAAQTSLSNLISGIFLVWERPFQVGDALQSGSDMGIVFSIDLLSIQLRTYDNKLIRIPNESLIKNSFVNITRFPIRRMDIDIGVAYKEDVERVMNILKEVADQNPFCLDEPEPVIIFKGFGDSSLEILFAPWFAKADYVALRNSLLIEVKRRFDLEGIEIPFPHRTLYTGAVTDPFPIRLVNSDVAIGDSDAGV